MSVHSYRNPDSLGKSPEWDAVSVESEQVWPNRPQNKQWNHPSTGDRRAYPMEPLTPSHSAYPPAYHRENSPNPGFDSSQIDLVTREEVDRLPSRQARHVSRKSRPWFCWIVSMAQVIVFVAQCGHAWKLTGRPIQTTPTFNPLIGPSVYNSINMGARFIPCMKTIENITDVVQGWPCPNTTTTAQETACSLAVLCANGATSAAQPRQSWRFVVPIFLHGGLIHIAFNLLVQLRLGAQVEKDIGTHLFIPIYLAAGVGGYLLGGNFAGNGVTSTGASGSIFSIISLTLLDLLYHWSQIERPLRCLLTLLIDVVISFVLGLLPGVDNFSHIGGMVIGLLLGVALLRSPDSIDRRMNPYEKITVPGSLPNHGSPDSSSDEASAGARGFFEKRKPGWYAFAALRIACLVLTVIIFVLLIQNFYAADPITCSWCKYLSCLPVSNWCSSGDLTTTTT